MRAWSLVPAPMVDPHQIRAFAERSEQEGWDGIMFPDNQSLWGDTYVSMTLAATVTSSLELCSASTNAGTRHPAVTASAVAAVGLVSEGRASLGIARGDSALAHLGAAPVPVATFDSYLAVVRALLHGQQVSFADLTHWSPSPPIQTLNLPDAPDASALHWLGDGTPVPIRVFASGPMAMAAGASHADQVVLGLGADVDRLRWGVDTVKELAASKGREKDVRVGALMSIAVSDDRDLARSLVSNIVASTVRFSSMHGRASGPLTDGDRLVYERVSAGYDMRAHGERGSQVSALTPEFIDAFALVGSAAECTRRLAQISALGVDDVLLVLPRNDTAAPGVRAARAVVDEVVPAVQELP